MEDETIDARGLRCPLPVLRLRKRLAALAPGGVARMLADDAMAEIDVPNFCREAGHELVEVSVAEDGHLYVVRRGVTPPDRNGDG